MIKKKKQRIFGRLINSTFLEPSVNHLLKGCYQRTLARVRKTVSILPPLIPTTSPKKKRATQSKSGPVVLVTSEF